MKARSRWAAAIVWMCAALGAVAQEEPAQDANPQGQDERPEAAVYLDTPMAEGQTDVAPDRRALTGMLVPGLGTWGPRHSFMVLGVSLAETADSGTLWAASGGWRNYASGVAQLQTVQYLGRSGQLRYAGAARADSSPVIYGADKQTSVHDLGISEQIGHGRWGVLLNDEATYSQGATIGDSGMEGMGSTITQLSQWNGVGGIHIGTFQLQGGVSPEQSILTMRAGRLSNTALAEIDRQIGSRSMFTAGAYDSVLHFFADGLFNLQQKGAVTGFDRQLTERDHLGLEYGYLQLNIAGRDSSLNTNNGMLLYGRRIAGALAVELGAGPQYVRGRGDYATYNDMNWQGRASGSVRVRGLDAQAGAMRMLTGGSGVLNGAMTNSAQVSVSRTFLRANSLTGSYGYARNAQVASEEKFDTQVAAVTYGRGIGGTLALFVSYNLQRQSVVGCTAVSCGVTGPLQMVGAGISWRARPIGIR